VKLDQRFWRLAAGIAVLVVLAAVAVLLVPPYYENWKLQRYLDALAEDPAISTTAPDAVRDKIVKQAATLGLPVHSDDVRVTRQDGALRIEVLYIVKIDLPVYSVDLHFRPGAGGV
jgi:hypothetical protein